MENVPDPLETEDELTAGLDNGRKLQENQNRLTTIQSKEIDVKGGQLPETGVHAANFGGMVGDFVTQNAENGIHIDNFGETGDHF